MIEARELSKAYGKRAVLNRVSFALPEGSVLAVVGANGAGKTTLLKLLALVNKPTGGSVLLGGQDAAASPRQFRKMIGYVPQANAFFPELTVRENIDYWRTGGKTSDAAALLGLGEVMDRKTSALSGGMQRRLNLALGLINNPSVLIMDEPLTGVDIKTRQMILEWIASLRGRNMTVIYSTHHADEIEGTADSILTLRGGEVTQFAPLDTETGYGVSGLMNQYI